MRKLVFLFITCITLSIAGCVEEPKGVPRKADTVQRQRTEQSLAEADRQIGMPAIVNFQERKLAKMIFELRDREDFICHAYLVNELNGTVGQYLGKCLGYGLPYSVQFTNPEKPVNLSKELGLSHITSATYLEAEYQAGIMPQADPNGLYMPEGLAATWVMLLDEQGEARPVYIESDIIVSPIPLHEVDNTP